MDPYTIALFGESERGEYCVPYSCTNIEQLLDYVGNPPPETRGIYYAIQAISYNRGLVFLRVREEGFGFQDYLAGLTELRKRTDELKISAICLPGVGDMGILGAVAPLCAIYHSVLITNESDLYDYLTELRD